MRVYNYTIIESVTGYYKYAKEQFSLMRRNDSKSIEEIKQTKYGQKMMSENFPLKYS